MACALLLQGHQRSVGVALALDVVAPLEDASQAAQQQLVVVDHLLRRIDLAVAQHAELVDHFDAGSEILEGSAAALLETLAIADPTAHALTKRVTGLVDRYLETHPRNDAWEISIASRLCYLGSAALGADLSARALHGEELARGEDLLVGCVAGFTVDIVARIPRLATVEQILRHHRQAPEAAPAARVPFGAGLLGVITRLAELEATTGTRDEAAAALRACDTLDTELVSELLDLYLPVGAPLRDNLVDLTDGEASGSSPAS